MLARKLLWQGFNPTSSSSSIYLVPVYALLSRSCLLCCKAQCQLIFPSSRLQPHDAQRRSPSIFFSSLLPVHARHRSASVAACLSHLFGRQRCHLPARKTFPPRMMCVSSFSGVPGAFAQAHRQLRYPIPIPRNCTSVEVEMLRGMRPGLELVKGGM